MLTIRPHAARGHFDHGWLDTRHSFSFGSYRDPHWMGFATLRVINEDVIGPRKGFGEHGHADMEIITYPVTGAVRHRDSLGHEEDITPGMIQHMTAGSGIRHAEFNPLSEPTHLLQIWITPREKGLAPAHASRSFPIHDQPGRLHLLASPDGEGDSLPIAQDAWMLAGVFEAGALLRHELSRVRQAWVQVVRGTLRANGTALSAGDGLGISDEDTLELVFDDESEVLIFELR
ncbi:MAG: pirin family protein [Phycisphaerales bacterium]